MGSHHDIEYKLISLEKKLEALGHFPFQKEDRALYALAKYYYTKYPENIIVEDLMQRFPYERRQQVPKTQMSQAESIAYIIREVSSLGYIPGPTENRELYSRVKYCYEHYADCPKIIIFKEKFPWISKKKCSMFVGMDIGEKIDRLEQELRRFQEVPRTGYGIKYSDRTRLTGNVLRYYEKYSDHPKIKRLMMIYPTDKFYQQYVGKEKSYIDYISDCLDIYNELPGDKTLPMSRLYHTCLNLQCMLRQPNGDLNTAVAFVKELGDKNILSPRLQSIYERIK